MFLYNGPSKALIKKMEDLFKVDENISLIKPELDLAPEMFKLVNSNRDFLNRYITFAQNKNTENQVSHFLREIISFNIGGQKFNMLVKYKDKLAGLIGLHRIYPADARAEIGYWMGEEFQGKGIMSKSIPVFLRYAFEGRAINRVELITLTSHHRNIKMVEKLGFIKEGTMKERYFMHDTFQDAVSYRMLKQEFLNK